MNGWKKSVTSLVLSLVYPNHCIPCKQPIKDGVLCRPCQGKLEPSNLGNWVKQVHHHEGMDKAYSYWYFNDILQDIIHPLKYADRAKIGFSLGKRAAEGWGKTFVQGIHILAPVPLHGVKKRERGYNQAYWIAKGMSEEWGIPINGALIRRKKYTQSQTTLNREERFQNMDKAFVTSRSLNKMKIAIIDDVLTTGATM